MNKVMMLAALAALVSACGGGGGGASQAPAQSAADASLAIPTQPVLANISSKGFKREFTISGTSGSSAVTGTGTFVRGPAVAVTMGNVAALQSTQVLTGSIIVNGTSKPLSSTSIEYVDINSHSDISADAGTDHYLYAPYLIPATIKAGDTGMAGTATIYGSSMEIDGNRTGRISRVFSVASDTNNSLLITYTADFYGHDCGKPSPSVPTICFKPYVTPTYVFNDHVSQTKVTYRYMSSGDFGLVSVKSYIYSGGSITQELTFTFK